MAKPKKYKPQEEKPQETKTKRGWWGPFFEDWGRLVIPLGIIAILVILRSLGILDDTGLGCLIGLLVFISLGTAFSVQVFTQDFPKWVKVSTIAMIFVYLAGCVFPFVMIIYPGTPDFTKQVQKGDEIPLVDIGSGNYTVEVYAEDLANKSFNRGTGAEGTYKIEISGETIQGKLSDTLQTVRGRRGVTRQVEQKHLMDVHNVVLPEGEKVLKVIRLDPSLGEFIRIQIFPTLIPAWVSYIVFCIIILFSAFLDGMFQIETEKWRLSAWMMMAFSFFLIFGSAYERGNVTSASVWSTIFGGVGGFMVGWALSWLSRKIIGKVRAKI